MNTIIAPIARSLARYAAGLIAGYGIAVPEAELAILIAALIAAGTEAVYALAKRKGWAT
ncbi:MAG: hypothetical protein II336_18175 [Loktanella sp.]|nr:hypothetical protein [Loktanella sp.]